MEDAVEILGLSAERVPEWVLEQLQKLLKRDRTSAAVLTLLAVVLLIDKRGGEAAATLKHLAARKDLKSRQDIVSVLSNFDDLMGSHPELRRLRAAAGYNTGGGKESAEDWLELLLSGEEVKDNGLLEIFDRGILEKRGADVLSSGFVPSSPAGELFLASSGIHSGKLKETARHLTEALSDPELVDRVTAIVSSLPFSSVSSMKPAELFKALNRNGRGGVVEKLLPLLASGDTEEWMDKLASELVLDSDTNTILFRLSFFIERNMPGTAASSVQGISTVEEDISQLIHGCASMAAGNREQATEFLSKAAASDRTAHLAREVLSEFISSGKASPASAIALAQAQLNTDDSAGAAASLKEFLDQKVVLEYLEKAILEVPGSSELQGCLALARLFSGDPEGYRTAAGTAVEIDSEQAEGLVEAGVSYSLGNRYAPGLVFAAEVGSAHIDAFDPSGILIKALCIQPDLAERVAEHPSGDKVLGMLLLLAACNHDGFVFQQLPDDVALPVEMIDKALSVWKEKKELNALRQLEVLAESTENSSQAHDIRVALSELGEDRSKGLLKDTLRDGDYRDDFLEYCTDREQAVLSIKQLFPDGPCNSKPEEIAIASDMLIRCGATEELFMFASGLLESNSEDNCDAAGRIVDIFIPTAGEEKSLSVPQVVDLLLMSGRISEAFSFARGDSVLLDKLKGAVSSRDSHSDAPAALLRENKVFDVILSNTATSDPVAFGEAMWRLGKRIAACSIWREAYSRTNEPRFLQRLQYAQECMGATEEANAVARLLSEKHPELTQQMKSGSTLSGNSIKMITFNFK